MYKPYSIIDFREGQIEGLEAWKIPQDAFKTLKNARLKRGVLEKRPGYTEYGQLVHWTATAYGAGVYGAGLYGGYSEVVSDNPVMGLFNYYYTNAQYKLLAMNTRRLNIYDTGTSAFTDMTRYKVHFKPGGVQNHSPVAGDVVEEATSGAYGTIEAVVIDHGTFAGADADGWLILTLGTIVGTFAGSQNLRDKNNPADIFGTSDGTQVLNEFTGSDDDFFTFCNWQDRGHFVNGVDQIQKYDDDYGFATPFQIDLDVEGGPDNDVDTCKWIFVVKNRLMLLYTTEKGTRYPNRARWSAVNSTTFTSAGYKDAPLDDEIISACMIGDILYVWFKERTMKLAYTGDSADPFKWVMVDEKHGSYSKMSVVKYGTEAMVLGRNKLFYFNQQANVEINQKIPDFVLNIMPTSIGYSYGIDLEEEKTYLLSYASLDSSDGKPDSILIFNYEDKSFAIWEISAHSFGWYSNLSEANISLDDYADGVSTDDMTGSLDDVILQGGYPKTLMGCRDGKVYTLNDGTSDDGSEIDFECESGEWNPFNKEGYKARLGWLDFLVDNNGAEFDVQLSIDSGRDIYKTQAVTCEDADNPAKEKMWLRVNAGATAENHIINISNTDTAIRPRIHAIVPYMERAGRMI